MPRPKSTGLPKAEEERLRLTHLLDVAADAFFELGYEATSTTEIATRAQCSKRELYLRFASKDELFLAVIDARTAKIADRVTDLFQIDTPIRETLVAVGKELLDSLLSEEHTALTRLVYSQALQFPQAAVFLSERGPDRGIAKLAAHLKRQAAKRKLLIPDAQLAAQQFAALLLGDALHRAMLGQPVPRSAKQINARAESAVEAFLKIYASP